MPKSTKGEEPDYLAETKLAENPFSFERLVKEAFLLEYGFLQVQEIAGIVGVSKGRISQIFSNPQSIRPDTVEKLLAPLKNREHKRQIVRAWTIECFGIDVEDRPIGQLTGPEVTRTTLKRIDRQIRESRLSTAAQTALEAAGKAKDWYMRQAFLDRAFFAFQRIDEPGSAMRVARMMADDAKEVQNEARLVTALMLKLRVLPALQVVNTDECLKLADELRLRAARLNANYREGSLDVPSENQVERAILGATLTLIERGLLEKSEGWLRAQREITITMASKGKSYQEGFKSHFVAARIAVILGETFAASELLEMGFRSGEQKNLNALEVCGLLEARILEQTEPLSVVSDHLVQVIQNCNATLDLYHKYLAENHLAHVEAKRF